MTTSKGTSSTPSAAANRAPIVAWPAIFVRRKGCSTMASSAYRPVSSAQRPSPIRSSSEPTTPAGVATMVGNDTENLSGCLSTMTEQGRVSNSCSHRTRGSAGVHPGGSAGGGARVVVGQAEDLLPVWHGVVVREHGRPPVLRGGQVAVAGAEVAARGQRRVVDLLRVAPAVEVGVRRPLAPRRRDELHGAHS